RMRILYIVWALCVAVSATAQRSIIDSLEKVAASKSDPAEAANAKAALAQKYYSAGNLRKAETILSEAFSEARYIKSDKALGAAWNARGVFYYHQNLFDSSIACFERSIALKRRSGD